MCPNEKYGGLTKKTKENIKSGKWSNRNLPLPNPAKIMRYENKSYFHPSYKSQWKPRKSGVKTPISQKHEIRVNAEISVTARISRKPLKNRKSIQITQMWYLGDIHPYHIGIQCKTPISRPTATPAKFPVKRRNCRNSKWIARVRHQDDKNTYNNYNTGIYSISRYTTVYRNPGCYIHPN